MRSKLALLALVLAAAPLPAAAMEVASDSALLDTAFSARSEGASGLSYLPGRGLVRWRNDDAGLMGERSGFSLSTATLDRTPTLTLLHPSAPAEGAQAFAFTFTRQWRAAVSVQAGQLNLDITPHAGLGLSSAGGQLAEAGAMLRLGARRVMGAVGAQDALDGSRLYLFAGASGRATGLNLFRSQALGQRDDPYGDGFIRRAEAGVGLRRGALAASFGYTYERITVAARAGAPRVTDHVGLTLSYRPR